MITSDFAKRLADKLIEQLKSGTAPWQQPWEAGQQLSPYNPTTGNRYRGVNILALMATERTDPRWMTYKQAQAQGWQVRAGEKGTQIQHWIWQEHRTRIGKDGKPELDTAGKAVRAGAVITAKSDAGVSVQRGTDRGGSGLGTGPGRRMGSDCQGGTTTESLASENRTFAVRWRILSRWNGYNSFTIAGTVLRSRGLLCHGAARARALDGAP